MRAYRVWRRGITVVSVLTLVATLTSHAALAHPLPAEDVIVLPASATPASETTSNTASAVAPGMRVELPAAAPGSPIYVLQVQPGASVTLPGGAPAPMPGPTREPGMIASGAPPPAAASTLPSQTLAPSSGSPAYVSGGLAEQAQQVSTAPGRRDAVTGSLPDRIAPLDTAQLSRSAGMRPDNANCGGLGSCAWPTQDTSGSSCTPDTRSCTSIGTSPLVTMMTCTGSGAIRTCEDPAAGSTASSVTPYAYPATNSSVNLPAVSPNAVPSLGYGCTNTTSLMATSASATGLPLAGTACPVLR